MTKDVSAAFFDIDHTITSHSTAIRCILYNFKRRKIPLKFIFSMIRPYFNYKKGIMNLENCDNMIDGMDGIPRTTLDEMGELSFNRHSRKDLYPEMVELIRNYQEKGIPVILATSSPRFVVEPYHRFLESEHLIATELEFDGEDKTSGRFDGPVAFDQGKMSLVKNYMEKRSLSPDNCAFYSDSIHDLPTLKLVGHPVAVNPDRELVLRAREEGWDILSIK